MARAGTVYICQQRSVSYAAVLGQYGHERQLERASRRRIMRWDSCWLVEKRGNRVVDYASVNAPSMWNVQFILCPRLLATGNKGFWIYDNKIGLSGSHIVSA